ncbi:hypothetical protein BDR22DRAFT_892788 [Usnea florida]
MPSFIAIQASSLQAIISSQITAQVTAQIAANNKVLLDQIKEIIGYGPAQQQITAPVNLRFVNTPTPQPSDQSHLHSNQQPNQSSQSSPHTEQTPPTNNTTNDTTATR